MSNNGKGRLTSKPEILLIEDDPNTRAVLSAMLAAEDYRPRESVSGSDGLAQASTRTPDLILIDLGLPDMDGIDVIREIRQWSHIPIIVISARNRESDKVKALDAGADDYVSKPFPPREVSARIRAALRRWTLLDKDKIGDTVSFGDISINLSARNVRVKGVDVHLTPNEYKLLQILLRHAGKVVTHRQLLNEVWGPEHLREAQYLRVFMGQLRRKLEADPANPKHFTTESGIGYRLLIE